MKPRKHGAVGTRYGWMAVPKKPQRQAYGLSDTDAGANSDGRREAAVVGEEERPRAGQIATIESRGYTKAAR